jgi:hypothetical protein
MTRFLEKYKLRHPQRAPRERQPGNPESITSRFRAAFFAVSYVSSYSGFLLLFFFQKTADFSPLWKQALVKVHIVAVCIWLFLCGMLFSVHVFPQLRAHIPNGRKSGLLLIALLVLMTFSGYGIQILPSPGTIDLSRYAHVFSGIAFCLLFIAHLALVRPRLRVALASATLLSLLVALPFFFLKSEPVFPDEIKLAPMSLDIPEPKKK